MMLYSLWTPVVALLMFVAPAAGGQASGVKSSQATAFLGTWLITMTEPQGAHETVRIWDQNGVIGATVQAEQFPPHDMTGIVKDGDMLVLTTTRFENGKPIWAVISLTLEGETMKMAQMLELSQTIKRGSGKKRAN
jgi:hypothetical protein